MLKHIVVFETWYHVRSPLFAVSFILFFFLAFGAATIEQLEIGGGGNVHINAPTAILKTLATLNTFAIFLVTAFVANAVIRDHEAGFAPLLRATQITKFDYLFGRFGGALAVACSVQCAIPLAMLIGTCMPWLQEEAVGPLVLGHYVFALFVLGVPTIVAMGAVFFALATATRSIVWTYVGVVGFLVLLEVSKILVRDPAFDNIGALLDPFALSAVNQATKYWTSSDHNTLLPPLEGVLFYNRVLWLTIGAVAIALAYALFNFDAKPNPASATPLTAERPITDTAPSCKRMALPSTAGRTRLVHFWALTRFEMAFIFKSPAYFVLLGLGVLNACGAMFSMVDELVGETHIPVTHTVVNALARSFTIVPIIIAIYYGGELVWRDRDCRIYEIVDATVSPNWAFLAPKVLAIALVLLTTFVAASLFGLSFQLIQGFTQIDPMALVLWFVLPNSITALFLAILSVFVQAIVPQKALGWGVMLIYTVSALTLVMLGFEHRLYSFGETAFVPLSDMNAMGHFWIGRMWHQAYWLSFCSILLIASHLIWRRGVETRLSRRLALLGQRLRGVPAVLLSLCTIAWLSLGGWIFYNTNILSRYSTGPTKDQWAADYETTILPFEHLPQPTVQHVTLKVDLYPRDIRAEVQGTYLLKNLTHVALGRVDIEFVRDLKILAVELDGATLEQDYPEFGHRIYALQSPMQPGEQRQLNFTTRLEYRGFANGAPPTRLVGNGTFLDNSMLAPVIGVTHNIALKDRAKRRKYNLAAEIRLPKLEDSTANAHHFLRPDSDWVTADITLSTDADQIPLAPGSTVSDTIANGRRTLVTRTEMPIHNYFSLQSARYAVAQDTWTGADGRSVELSVYYHPDHPYNVQRMLDAMKVSLEVCSHAFSPYPFTQAKILEFPAYESFAQSFAHTVPYSEAVGFISAFDDADNAEKIDIVTYITAHEMAHQWWGHQIAAAYQQGMSLLYETFAQYSALLVMEKLYGKQQIRKFLRTELEGYLRSRDAEEMEEVALNRVENQTYIHYQKGSLVMYWLKEVVGEQAVNNALKKLLAKFAFKSAPYPSSTDFLRLLRAEVGPQHEQLIIDLFEKITLYDLKARDAKVTKRADGRYTVTFLVDAKKLYADGQGHETESPLDEGFDIGVFTHEPGKKSYSHASVLLIQRMRLKSGVSQIEVTVDQMPAFVGVDPYNMRIDRNSNDNLCPVKVSELGR